jgi:hypothetical protein
VRAQREKWWEQRAPSSSFIRRSRPPARHRILASAAGARRIHAAGVKQGDSSELRRRRLATHNTTSTPAHHHPHILDRIPPLRRTSPRHIAMDRLSRMLAAAQGMGGMGGPAQDTNLIDNSETVYISSLALLKMLRHGRAGVPMEVMGLMLGEFVDDYTVRVVDVFAMPQSGTGVSVEAVDPVFQTKMMDMLRQTGRCVVPRGVSRRGLTNTGKRRSSAGTTHIQALAAGCRRLTSTPSSRLSSSRPAPSPSSSTPSSRSRARSSSTLSAS